MLGFDPISVMTAGYMLVSASACPAPQQNTVFDLVIDEMPVKVDQSHRAVEITALKLNGDQQIAQSGDAISMNSVNHDAAIRQEMSTEGVSFYNGLTEGKLYGQTEYQISMQVVNGQACIYADKVTLSLHYDPTIYIAAEYNDRPCANQVVTAHENMHVERDLNAIQDFINRAKPSMQEFLDGLGGQGPYPADQAKDGANQLRDLIQGDVEQAILPGLQLLRQQYQDGLDTPENYKAQAALCPSSDWTPDVSEH